MSKYANIYKDAVISNIKWLNNILTYGSSIAGIIVLLKIKGDSFFSWTGIEYSISQAWIVILLLTIAHIYVCVLAIKSVFRLVNNATTEDCKEVYIELTSKSGIFLRGLIARFTNNRRFYIRITKMQLKDPTMWLSYLSAIVVLLAIIPFHFERIINLILLILFSFFILFVNWITAAIWINTVSELSDPPKTDQEKAKFTKGFTITGSA